MQLYSLEICNYRVYRYAINESIDMQLTWRNVKLGV